MRRVLMVSVVTAALLCSTSTARAEYTQRGGQASMATQTIGIQSTITQPSPQGDSGTRYYWPGIILNNGDFLQAGFSDQPGAACGLTWFYEAFNSLGQEVRSNFGNCGLTGTHTFQILKEGTSGKYFTFIARMDGAQLDYTTSAASWGYIYNLDVFSEYTDNGRVGDGSYRTPPANALPGVNYSLLYYNCASGCSHWSIPTRAVASGSYVHPCPPTYVHYRDSYQVNVYSSTTGTCVTDGSYLW
jgi:hypothetical protein